MKSISIEHGSTEAVKHACLEAASVLHWTVVSDDGTRAVFRHTAGPSGKVKVWINEGLSGATLTAEGSPAAESKLIGAVKAMRESIVSASVENASRADIIGDGKKADNEAVPSAERLGAGWYPHPLDPAWENYWDGLKWDGRSRPVESGEITSVSGPTGSSTHSDVHVAATHTAAVGGAIRSGKPTNHSRTVVACIAVLILLATFSYLKSSNGSFSSGGGGSSGVVVTPDENYGVVQQDEPCNYQYQGQCYEQEPRLSNGCPVSAPYPQSAYPGHCANRP